MLIYRDIFSGDELCSDSYPTTLVDDVVYEFTGKHVTRKEGEIVLPGANPAEGDAEDFGEENVESGVDIVLNHQLVEMPLYQDVKIFKEWVKEYLKKLVERMQSDGVSAEEVKTFKGKMQTFIASLLKQNRFKDLQFFCGNGEMASEGQLAIMEYRTTNGVEKPVVMLIKQGLIEEKCDQDDQLFKEHFSVTPDLIHRLGFSCSLKGHSGCVNCLQWNEAGTLLASGSDDFNVIIWDPFLRRSLHTIQTGHTNNVFSVKFLPETNDQTVISGAGDGKIFMHDLQSTEGTKHVFACHFGRVKRLATCPSEPHMIWSASEDGLVMQFDCRERADCTTTCDHVLINLNAHLGPEAEVKCISLNSCRPELLAVGANDPFARVYDRRMLSVKKIRFPPVISLSSFSLSVDGENYDFPMKSVKYFVAGHLPVKQPDFRRRYRPLASTYLTFSPCGNDLLVNLGGEQIYLFDINTYRRSVIFDLRKCFGHRSQTGDSSGGETSKSCTNGSVANGFPFSSIPFTGLSTLSSQDLLGKRFKPLSSESTEAFTEVLKKKANAAFESKDYSLAVALYSEAICLAPSVPVLYANRAASYMKRNWDGDVYAALRDCCTTLKLDSSYMKAFFRVARCLYELKYATESRNVLKIFSEKFPDYAETRAFLNLQAELGSQGSAVHGNHHPKRQRNEDANLGDVDSEDQDDSGSEPSSLPHAISQQEVLLRETSSDYAMRFCGHCNTTTDIKEANFFGRYGEYIVAGSDDGQFFIWEKKTGNIVRILHGDESIVNCLQPHPTVCLLATSGIEAVVKLWSPKAQDGANDPLIITDFDTATIANQRRMNADPLEVMLMNIGYHMAAGANDEAEGAAGGNDSALSAIQCRQI